MKSILKVRNCRAITVSLLLGLTLAGLWLMLARPRVVKAATTWTVTSNADGGGTCAVPGGTTCTLRQAIATAADGDTINFAAGLTTITLTSAELSINKSLTINGPGATLLTVRRDSAAPPFRIFKIGNFNVTISGLTVTNGDLPFPDNSGEGGLGIFTVGTVTITNSTISGNGRIPDFRGGGISNRGNLTITNSTISGNVAGFGGGGGINNRGTATITNSTISGNRCTSADGAGILNDSGMVTITNSTVSGNVEGFGRGGGIANFGGTVTLINSTISGNSAEPDNPLSVSGGGVANFGTSNVRNTIIAGNTAPTGPDVFGAQTSQGYNLIGKNDGSTGFTNGVNNDQVGSIASPLDPKLELDASNKPKLADNGGPTPTIKLLSGSPAIDKGHSSGSNTDQRGFARPVDTSVIGNPPGGDGSDIGAYEVQADQLQGCNNVNLVVSNSNDGGSGSLRDVIANTCAGSTLTFSNSTANGAVNFYDGAVHTINLTSGELLINKSLTINGPGANLLTVRRSAGNFRIFNIAAGNFNVTISGLMITNGSSNGGGGILSGLNVSGATLTVMGCAISTNAASNGGGIFNSGSGAVAITNSTISGNSTGGFGGGIYTNDGPVTISNSTISGNSTSNNDGGGIFNNGGTVTVTNGTISDNHSPNGSGGGIYNGGGTVTIKNTIIALNTASGGPDFFGALTSQGFNLIGNSSGLPITSSQSSDQVGTAAGTAINPLVGPLANNGGPTQTQALPSNSPPRPKPGRPNTATGAAPHHPRHRQRQLQRFGHRPTRPPTSSWHRQR